MSHDFEGTRRVVYGEGMTFIPVCSKCYRFVRAYYRKRAGWKEEDWYA